MKKRLFSLLLAALLLFSLSACGTKQEGFNSETAFQNHFAATHTSLLTGNGIVGACFLNGKAYYAVDDPDHWQIAVYTLDENNTCQALSGFDVYQAQQDSAFSTVTTCWPVRTEACGWSPTITNGIVC